MYLYLLLNIASISIPFAYSFHKKMNFIRYWKPVFSSILITGICFIIWDVIFTQDGIWGFNEAYHLPLKIASLPLEEWLFFICIPYASIFIHYALEYFCPKVVLSKKIAQILTLLLIILLVTTIAFNTSKAYTTVNFSLGVLVFCAGLYNLKHLQRFYISFLIILVPFFIVNGILTGSFIEEPVVWYNNNENLGIRIATIPIEDTIYAFNLLFISVLLIETQKKKQKKELL